MTRTIAHDAVRPFLILGSDHPTDAVVSVGQWMAGGLRTFGIDARVLSIPRQSAEAVALLDRGVEGIIALGPMALHLPLMGQARLWRETDAAVHLFLLDAVVYDLCRVPLMREFLQDAEKDLRLRVISPEAGYLKRLGRISEGGCLPNTTTHIPFGHFANLNSYDHPYENRLCVIGTIGNELGLRSDIATPAEVVAQYGSQILSSVQRQRLLDALCSQDVPDMPLGLVMDVLDWNSREVCDPRYLPLICAVDSLYKRVRRFSAVRSLSGLPVDFYGSGWSDYFPDEPQFRFLGNIRHQQIAQVCSRYAGVVNFDPNWEDGVHDRVYTACAMGTPVITNSNNGLNQSRLPTELLYTYQANNPRLREVAEQVLAKESSDRKPYTAVLHDHSWSQRMSELLSC